LFDWSHHYRPDFLLAAKIGPNVAKVSTEATHTVEVAWARNRISLSSKKWDRLKWHLDAMLLTVKSILSVIICSLNTRGVVWPTFKSQLVYWLGHSDQCIVFKNSFGEELFWLFFYDYGLVEQTSLKLPKIWQATPNTQ
jgi:hypothetical protein